MKITVYFTTNWMTCVYVYVPPTRHVYVILISSCHKQIRNQISSAGYYIMLLIMWTDYISSFHSGMHNEFVLYINYYSRSFLLFRTRLYIIHYYIWHMIHTYHMIHIWYDSLYIVTILYARLKNAPQWVVKYSN